MFPEYVLFKTESGSLLWEHPSLSTRLATLGTFLRSTLPAYGFGGTAKKTFHINGTWIGIPMLNKLGKMLRARTAHRIVKKLSKKNGRSFGFLSCGLYVCIASVFFQVPVMCNFS